MNEYLDKALEKLRGAKAPTGQREAVVFKPVVAALEDFCRAMKIPALLVTETQEGTVNASARLSPGQVPELRVTGGLLKQAELLFQRTGNLEQMDRTVLSILGHELSHIAHRDALQLERRARKAALVSGGIFLLLAGSVLLLPAAAPLPALLLVLYLGADLLFGNCLLYTSDAADE